MFLTREDIRELTGYVRPSAQCRALRVMGVPFRSRLDGRPIVLRDDLPEKPAKPRRASGPDLAALDKLG